MLLRGTLVGWNPGCRHCIGLRVLAQMLLQTEERRLSNMLMSLPEVQNHLLGVCIDMNSSTAIACQNMQSVLSDSCMW